MKIPAVFNASFGGVALVLTGEVTLADNALTTAPVTPIQTTSPISTVPVSSDPVATAPATTAPVLSLPPRMMTDAWALNQKATQYPLETRSLKYDAQDGKGFIVRETIPVVFKNVFGPAHIGFDTSMPWDVVDSVKDPSVLTHVTITNCFSGDGSDPKNWSNPFVVTAPIANAKVEGGAAATKDSDKHVLRYDQATGLLYEFWQTFLADPVNGTTAAAYAVWRVNELHQNPPGTNSASAGGLPILPLLLRYDEAASGLIPHALRMTFNLTRANANGGGFILPACHAAGNNWGSPVVMGARMCLRADFPMPPEPIAQAIVQCLKDYGPVPDDNGRTGSIICDDDSRWDADMLQRLSISMTLNDFVLVNAGPIIDSEGLPVL